MKPSRTPSHVRMIDVARRAGVSAITVSRALRTPEKVSADTRARIMEAARAMRYLPNYIAGSLSSQRSNVVAAIIPNIRNPLYASMVQGLSEMLRQHGLHLMIANSGHSRREEEEVISTCLRQRPCGLLLHQTSHTPGARELLHRAGIPVVEVGDLARTPIDTVVSYSNYAAAKAMTTHLAARGYRRIAIVTSPVSDRATKRYHGYRAALGELGLPFSRELRVQRVSGYREGGVAVAELMGRAPAPDAILFSSAASGIGALFECTRRGWSVPSRVAIASVDDTELAAEVVPALTVVRLPRYEIGRRAAEVIIEGLKGEAGGARRIDLGFEIVERESA